MGTRLQQSGVRLGSHDIGARGSECNDQSFKHNIVVVHAWVEFLYMYIDKSCKGCKTAASTLEEDIMLL